MTTPPYQPGPYGQQDPYGQQPGGGYGQYGQQRPPEQPQYGGQGAFGNSTDQTQQLGGQPQYGGQYGATQQWQQPGAPQYGGGFGGLPPEPPKNKTGMIVAIVVISVLVIGGAAVGIYFATKGNGDNSATGTSTTQKTSGATESSESSEDETTTSEETTTAESGGDAIDAQPGDCIKVNVASSTDADIETVDCSSNEAIYRVATREETDTGDCPNDQYVSYTEEGQLLLCLQLNVREGDCLEVTDSEDKRADCTSDTATDKVLKVIDGVDDETQCPDTTTTAMTYPQPPLTICLGAPTS